MGEVKSVISNVLRHEFLGLVLSIIQRILFYKVNVLLLLDEVPTKIITCFTVE